MPLLQTPLTDRLIQLNSAITNAARCSSLAIGLQDAVIRTKRRVCNNGLNKEI